MQTGARTGITIKHTKNHLRLKQKELIRKTDSHWSKALTLNSQGLGQSQDRKKKPHLEPGDLRLGPASDLAGKSPHLSFLHHCSAQLCSKLWWALAPDARTSLHC
jgi:hypothetical protein